MEVTGGHRRVDTAAWTPPRGHRRVDTAAWTPPRGHRRVDTAAWTPPRGHRRVDTAAWTPPRGHRRVDTAAWTPPRGHRRVDTAAWTPPRGHRRVDTAVSDHFVAVSLRSGWSRFHVAVLPCGSRNAGLPPEVPLLPPSDRRCRLGRRLRSSLLTATRRPRDGHATATRPPYRPDKRRCSHLCKNQRMELTWYGRTCVRMKGKDAVVVADAYQAIVGPTGRGITGDIVTYSHPDDSPLGKGKGRMSRDGSTVIPGSLEEAFCLDGSGEYEIKDVLITGVRTYRDEHKGKERGRNVAFTVELDGVHIIHLGDIGHLLTEDKLTDIGPVDVACIVIGGALPANKAAELVSQLDAKVVVPMVICDGAEATEALAKFLHEVGVSTPPALQSKLVLMPSSLPGELTPVLLEQRGKV